MLKIEIEIDNRYKSLFGEYNEALFLKRMRVRIGKPEVWDRYIRIYLTKRELG